MSPGQRATTTEVFVKTRGKVAGALVTVIMAASVVLSLGPTAPPARGHTGLVSTSPKAGATLRRPPRRVTVTFAQQLRSGSIVVRKSGRIVSTGAGGRDPANVRRLRVALPQGLGAGRYAVRWRATAADGHVQAGTFSFRVSR